MSETEWFEWEIVTVSVALMAYTIYLVVGLVRAVRAFKGDFKPIARNWVFVIEKNDDKSMIIGPCTREEVDHLAAILELPRTTLDEHDRLVNIGIFRVYAQTLEPSAQSIERFERIKERELGKKDVKADDTPSSAPEPGPQDP